MNADDLMTQEVSPAMQWILFSVLSDYFCLIVIGLFWNTLS